MRDTGSGTVDDVETVAVTLWYPRGDPGLVRSSVPTLVSTADALRGAAADARNEAASVEGANRGRAVDAFSGHADALVGLLGSTAGDAIELSRALEAYADAIEASQRTIKADVSATRGATITGEVPGALSVTIVDEDAAASADRLRLAAEDERAQLTSVAGSIAGGIAVDPVTAPEVSTSTAGFSAVVDPFGAFGGLFEWDALPGNLDGVAGPRDQGMEELARRFAPILFLHPDEDIRPGAPDGAGGPVPTYYDYRGDRIEYWIYYPDNNFRNLGETVSDHRGDWERVTVYLDEDRTPQGVGYDYHGHTGYVPWDEVEQRGGRPVGDVALGGHATYPERGSYDEPVGPYNDLAGGPGGERGERIDPRPIPLGEAPPNPPGDEIDSPLTSPRPAPPIDEVEPMPEPDDDVH